MGTILKIIGAVFVYLLCGVGVLELFRLHDRHTDYMHQWISEDDSTYEAEQIFVVVFYPIFSVFFIPWLIGKFILAFIRVVRIIFTTLAYTIVTLIKVKDKKMDLPTDTQKCCHGCENYNNGYCILFHKENVREYNNGYCILFKRT